MWLKFFNKPDKAHSDVPKKRVTIKRPKFSYQWRYWWTIKNFFRTLYQKVMGSVPSGGNLNFSSYFHRLNTIFSFILESNTAAQEDSGTDWKGGRASTANRVRTPKSGAPPMQNVGKVKFDPPSVPVIFILGGPGSGKVTHCDTLMQEKRGVTHINMMDLLQQYAIGNGELLALRSWSRSSQVESLSVADMQDFSQLSSRTVTEVLMLEMKMSPAAKTYLVSGYPRSMRDVVEYSEKVNITLDVPNRGDDWDEDGLVIIDWCVRSFFSLSLGLRSNERNKYISQTIHKT
jgi:Adenylate kinase